MQAASDFSSLENMMQIMNSTHDTLEDDNHAKSCKNRGKCGHCTELNKMLLSAEQKYSKLLSENYVGELTIRYLKQKNKELLHKISRNTSKQNRFPLNPISIDQNKKYFDEQVTNLTESQNLIETFNPKELKKILSQPLEYQPDQTMTASEHMKKSNTQTRDRSQTNRERLGVSSDKTHLKKKAEQRLKQTQFYKNNPDLVENPRKITKLTNFGSENTEFRFY